MFSTCLHFICVSWIQKILAAFLVKSNSLFFFKKNTKIFQSWKTINSASLRRLPLLTEISSPARLDWLGVWLLSPKTYWCFFSLTGPQISVSHLYLDGMVLSHVQGSNVCLFIPLPLFICIKLTSWEDTISAASGAEFGATLGPDHRGLRTSLHMARQRHGRHFYCRYCCDVVFNWWWDLKKQRDRPVSNGTPLPRHCAEFKINTLQDDFDDPALLPRIIDSGALKVAFILIAWRQQNQRPRGQ